MDFATLALLTPTMLAAAVYVAGHVLGTFTHFDTEIALWLARAGKENDPTRSIVSRQGPRDMV